MEASRTIAGRTSNIHVRAIVGLLVLGTMLPPVLLVGWPVNPPAWTYTVLHTFAGGTDGAFPGGALIGDKGGNLYGTTGAGGIYGNGVVFKISPTGQGTVLYSFAGGTDGVTPQGGLIEDSSGNLYGTTVYGGDGPACGFTLGCGVVFKLSPNGEEAILHSFQGNAFSGPDGANPLGGLVQDSAGNLYGTTYYGGLYGSNLMERVR